ncbi:hypothetical protein T265_02211 [Opisthorchis viverrini]|uniref:Uncharacterized protein n=1 Tax=Opisthorchis viverrini TaxID=6198 RepID=A0A074ZZX3_OPIVI|nr:hypothetical protein T265_02211 [Opisthorchis viverrini]KER31567.1 hypothetical protein T265_02211 [Opisthorchis viverrini]
MSTGMTSIGKELYEQMANKLSFSLCCGAQPIEHHKELKQYQVCIIIPEGHRQVEYSDTTVVTSLSFGAVHSPKKPGFEYRELNPIPQIQKIAFSPKDSYEGINMTQHLSKRLDFRFMLKIIMNEGFSWVPGESPVKTESECKRLFYPLEEEQDVYITVMFRA